ncbi:kinetochore-associated Ndc80 complex subunit ndc80 [Gonapodya sp. JEL0774]|nr:kinetochore-associated Ndc80 complex subunit ndc80 [Gonapodya sp. JEL0774]
MSQQNGRFSMASGRMSMAGPLRASNVANLRPSGIGGLADQFSQMSLAGNQQVGGAQNAQGRQGSLAGNSRRSSSLASARPSLLPTSGPQISKDPRPLRDKAWQTASAKQLIQFLMSTGYAQALSVKQLQSPSQKDFQNMFRHMLDMIDPNFEFTKKFEEEVPAVMKSLKYPFADSITKSHMISVGSMHSWPTCLGILMWMMELVVASEHADPLEQNSDFADNGFASQQDPAASGERTFFEYVSRAYEVFLAGGDNFDAMDRELVNTYDKKTGAVLGQIEQLQRQSEALEESLVRLGEGTDPLAILKADNLNRQGDMRNYEKYNSHLKKKVQAETEGWNNDIQETKAMESQLAEITLERTRLQEVVDAQEIRPEDVDRMNAEKESLARQIQVVSSKGEELSQMAWDSEIAGQKVFDRLEKKVQEYNAACYRMDLLEPSSTNAAGVKYELELNPQPKSKEDVGSVDLERVIKPALFKLMSTVKDRIRRADEEVLAFQEKRDRISEQTSVKSDEVHEQVLLVKRLADEYSREFESSKEESAAANAEAEKIELALRQLKGDMNAGLKEAQERKKSLEAEYHELERLAEEISEKAATELSIVVDAIIDYRERTSKNLDQLIEEVTTDGEDARRVFAGGIANPIESLADVESDRVGAAGGTLPGAPLVAQGGAGVGALPLPGVSLQLPALQTPRTPKSKSRSQRN